MKKSEPNPSVLTARVIRVDDLMGPFLGYMPNPDEVLSGAGEAISVYRSMRYDPRVKSLLRVAKSAVLNVPLRLEQGDAPDEVMETGQKAVAGLPLYGLVRRLLSAMDYGYAVVEVIWKNREGWWFPVDLVLRKPERFAFDAEGRLLFNGISGQEELWRQDYKWLVYRFDKDAENPYGTSALASCYWPWKFKKAGLEFWLMAAEKFAVPSILGLFESQEGEDKVRERALRLSEMLSTIQSGSGGAVANVKDIRVLESPEALSEFKTLMDWCDTQIAYGIVFQSLAVQEAENGTRAQAQVHEDTFIQASKGVCRDIAPVLQTLMDWVVQLNHGPEIPAPAVAFDLDDFASWEVVRDAIDRGVPVSLSSLYDRYGLPEPADEADAFLKPEPAASPLLMADEKKKPARRIARLC